CPIDPHGPDRSGTEKVLLQPFMEQTPAYDNTNWNIRPYDRWNGNDNIQTQSTKLPVFNCPSNPSEQASGAANFTYAVNTGTSHMPPHRVQGQPASWPSGPYNGMVAFMLYDQNPQTPLPPNWPKGDSMVKFASITDGTANTAFYSEFLIADVSKTDPTNKAQQKYQVYNHWANGSSTEAVRQDCLNQGAKFDIGRWQMRGAGWAWSFMGTGNGYCHTMLPNERSCHVFNGGHDWYGRNLMTAGSEHPGSVNVALADGSVRTVAETVDQDVWWALGTRNGGESVQLP
ncbi:MAG: DUF1559 domain-containing protein, partial [Planctomycetes bacterium]|nr:DUF1559 domain-containing protein [Planctomycetota bacterium]